MGLADGNLPDLLPEWKKVWRDGVAPELSFRQLHALRTALETDKAHLVQGVTTSPPPMQGVLDWPCEAGCLISYPFAFEDNPDPGPRDSSNQTVGDVEEFFAKVCFEADKRLGEPAAVRHLLNWFDDTPRDVMRKLLLEEVRRTMSERSEAIASQAMRRV